MHLLREECRCGFVEAEWLRQSLFLSSMLQKHLQLRAKSYGCGSPVTCHRNRCKTRKLPEVCPSMHQLLPDVVNL